MPGMTLCPPTGKENGARPTLVSNWVPFGRVPCARTQACTQRPSRGSNAAAARQLCTATTGSWRSMRCVVAKQSACGSAEHQRSRDYAAAAALIKAAHYGYKVLAQHPSVFKVRYRRTAAAKLTHRVLDGSNVPDLGQAAAVGRHKLHRKHGHL